MQQNFNYPYSAYQQQTQTAQPMPVQGQGASAVSINIIGPQAYSGNAMPNATCPVYPNNQYSLYGANSAPNLPLYPQNYNNMMNAQYNVPLNYQSPYPSNQVKNSQDLNASNGLNNTYNATDTSKTSEVNNVKETKEEEKTKKIVPLTDDYIKSLENYMNDNNPKVRLIGAKELLNRFKEDENRKNNPSLMPLLNKALKDTSAAVRILALIALQSEYAAGNEETISILKDIQTKNKDKIGEDSLLASEILLKMGSPEKISVPMTQDEIQRAQKAEKKKGNAK